MSDSTTLLDTISENQSQKATTANELFDAVSPATLWGRRATTTSGLTWGYYGGRYKGGSIASGTLTLTNTATNYIEANPITGAVSSNTTAFTAGYLKLYSTVVSGGAVTSYTDYRETSPKPRNIKNLAAKTSAYTATFLDEVVTGDATGAAFTITLPAAASSTGLELTFKKIDVSGNAVTIDGNASETIDGATTYALTTQYQKVTIICDGTNWLIIG